MNTPLIAHWKLNGDAQDATGTHHGRLTNIGFGPGPGGGPGGAATFNGLNSVIEVPDHAALRLGTAEFTAALWARCQKPMRGVFGDLLSKFDGPTRCGFSWNVSGSSAAYSSMSDTRHLHFGIDDGMIGAWEDCGRPWPSNPLITGLVAFEGRLYAGIADAADPKDAGRVFRYEGGRRWIDCGRLGADPKHLSAMSMLVHDGKLYAGTGVWDWSRAGDKKGVFQPSPAHVFVYEGGTTWRDLGQISDRGVRVLSLASFENELYAGLDKRGGGHCVKYDGSNWTDLGAPDGQNFECLLPLGGVLYGLTHGSMYRYAGPGRWECIGSKPHGITQIHSATVYQGKLHAGTWPQGYVLRYEGGQDWTITGRVGIPEGLAEINEINSLTVHNGKLYAGVLPKAQLWRYETDGQWTLIGNLAGRADFIPDNVGDHVYTWMRVTCLATHDGRLFAGTGTCHGEAAHLDLEKTCGRVWAWQAGHMVSHEHDLGGDWVHLAAVRAKRQLRLYVNGELAEQSALPSANVLDLTVPRNLLIGAGPQGSFDGALADVRLYAGALDAGEIRELAGHSRAPSGI